MKASKKIANLIAKASLTMAKKACGTASMAGTHQVKEPAALKNIVK